MSSTKARCVRCVRCTIPCRWGRRSQCWRTTRASLSELVRPPPPWSYSYDVVDACAAACDGTMPSIPPWRSCVCGFHTRWRTPKNILAWTCASGSSWDASWERHPEGTSRYAHNELQYVIISHTASPQAIRSLWHHRRGYMPRQAELGSMPAVQ